jgi:MarR family transcriptional regulator, 2-MHQ and catechol-resistance regulon repressor
MVAPRSSSRKPRDAAGVASELGALLGKARRLTFGRAGQRLEAKGESVHAWQLMNHLRRLGSATQRELAASAAQHPAGVSRLLEDLETQGRVVRRRSKEDRRKLVVELTAKGRANLAAMQPEVERGVEEALSHLRAPELLALRDLLRKLCDGPAAK